MSQLSNQELKYIAEGIVRKRYSLIQIGAMLCITIFVLIAWQFATANFIWFIVGLLGLWLLIFEPLRHIEMKKELRKLYKIHGDVESSELIVIDITDIPEEGLLLKEDLANGDELT